MYNFDALIQRNHSDSAKWQKYADRDIIPMWVADMDFTSPPVIMEALHQRVAHGIFGYGVPPKELVDAVITYLHQTYQWLVDPQWIIWLPGLVTGLNVACRSVGSPGQKVLTTVPVYPPFLTAPQNSEKKLLTSPMLYSDRQWRIDFDHIQKVIDPQTTLFILCNPHNPTGRVFTQQELLKLIYLRNNREITDNAVSNIPGLKMGIVEATYLAWIDARQLDIDNPVRFFEKAGVGLSDGRAFKGPGFIRLNFGCPRKRLEQALTRMTVALS